jgi:hypothetical protein
MITVHDFAHPLVAHLTICIKPGDRKVELSADRYAAVERMNLRPKKHKSWPIVRLACGAYYRGSPSHSGAFTTKERCVALGYGAVSLTLFFGAVAVMMTALYKGLHCGFGRLTGWERVEANTALLLQFPILNSVFLSLSLVSVEAG